MPPTNLIERIAFLENENAVLKEKLKSFDHENSIYQSQSWWQTIIDSLPNPLFIKDENHIFVLVNQAFQNFVGFTKEELIGKSDHNFFLKEQADIFLEMDAEVLHSGRTNWNEEKITVKDEEFELLTSKARIQDTQANLFVLGLITDISDNKNQQVVLLRKNEEIAQQKENIEILLKEVHHRVKNNLQIVTSLLNLQMGQLKDESSKDAFLNCQNRIQAMGRVHDLLTNSDNYADVNFKEYLSILVENIKRTFNTSQKINFDIQVPHFSFNIDTIIPLGLLINEIITNSVKHGIREKEVLNISIKLIIDKRLFILIISDDGVGVQNASNSFENPSLGLELIALFCNQLGADSKLKANDKGVSYQIEFEL